MVLFLENNIPIKIANFLVLFKPILSSLLFVSFPHKSIISTKIQLCSTISQLQAPYKRKAIVKSTCFLTPYYIKLRLYPVMALLQLSSLEKSSVLTLSIALTPVHFSYYSKLTFAAKIALKFFLLR